MATYPCKRHLFPYVVHHGGNSSHGHSSKYTRETHGVVIHNPQRQRYRGTRARDGRSQYERVSGEETPASMCGRSGARPQDGSEEKSRNETEQGCPDRRNSAGNHRVGGISGIRQG